MKNGKTFQDFAKDRLLKMHGKGKDKVPMPGEEPDADDMPSAPGAPPPHGKHGVGITIEIGHPVAGGQPHGKPTFGKGK